MIKFTWKKIEKYSFELLNKFNESKMKFDYIIGINRGGLIPALIISNQLDCKLICIGAKSYTGKKRNKLNIYSYPVVNLKNKNVLIVDEICDTGITLNTIKKKVKQKYNPKQIITSSLIINKLNCKVYPDFHVIEIENKTKEWIGFPWDKK